MEVEVRQHASKRQDDQVREVEYMRVVGELGVATGLGVYLYIPNS